MVGVWTFLILLAVAVISGFVVMFVALSEIRRDIEELYLADAENLGERAERDFK